MGATTSMFQRPGHFIEIKTGDHQGTEKDENIFIILIELQRAENSFDKWFVEWIKIKHDDGVYVFPINGWIKPGSRTKFQEHDSELPQYDKFPEQRKKELEEKKKTYAFAPVEEGMPCQVKILPDSEKFSLSYQLVLGTETVIDQVDSAIIEQISRRWKDLDDLKNVYRGHYNEPTRVNRWKSDFEFRKQRLTGCNPLLIQLCTRIPEKFGVTNDMLSNLLEGLTIESAIEKKRLFIVDLDMTKELPTTDPSKTICSPIALFFSNQEKDLLPVAIQLFQDKSDDNPVFLPTDSEYTWMLAKMWYNNADASYHQSATHLGMTHLLMESVAAATHSCLSPSHPLFRLMAPHFMYIMSINSLALTSLVNEGGWVDLAMSIGRIGMFEIVKRRFKTWRMDIDGNFPKEIESRGLIDPEVLHNYHFRDDGLLLWNEIAVYVNAVVNGRYDTIDKIANDYELQDWHKVLSLPVNDGGCDIKGIPGNGSFTTNEEIAQTITSIIFISSVMHAAVNFGLYDEYAFPPHYPASLNGEPPKNKNPKTEDDILNALPDKKGTLDVMEVTHLLSKKATNGLGDFETEYQFDPVGAEAVKKFRDGLKKVGQLIDERNNGRHTEYTFIHPSGVPNAISI
ncbi:polyunsaturated fatty acid 5-lipoxygenase-like [Antedon mediterranea]|uniref:polyunsaturated fatty acid 5-lipoxygenase-like n=1 Tax=Antedon mediterranea TaxID=105859 RepID=UPI003AF5A416